MTIPEGVEEIGSYAFEGCCSLRSLTLPRSLQRMDNAFCDRWCLGEECSGLTLRVHEGSHAHRYAMDNNIPCELI